MSATSRFTVRVGTIGAIALLLTALSPARANDDAGKGTGNERPGKVSTAIAKGLGKIRLDGDMLALLKARGFEARPVTAAASSSTLPPVPSPGAISSTTSRATSRCPP